MANTHESPQGWQNLSPIRQRVRERDNVLREIRKLYAAAEEIQIGDDYAYISNHFLIGIAWHAQAGSSWWYAVMSATMFGAGIRCSIERSGARNRVRPGVTGPGIFHEIIETPQNIELQKPNRFPELAPTPPVLESPKRPRGRPRKVRPEPFTFSPPSIPIVPEPLPEHQPASVVSEPASASERASLLTAVAARLSNPGTRIPRLYEIENAEAVGSFLVKRQITRLGTKIWVWAETKDKARELGPFNTRKEAIQAAEEWAASA